MAAPCRCASWRVRALYISPPAQLQAQDMAPRQAAFISAQLNALQTALAETGIPLLFHEVADFNASIETVKNVCRQHDVSHLFYNYTYEFNERQRNSAGEKTVPPFLFEPLYDAGILHSVALRTG
ncbi:deoxyribodipyrimidine photo-lyase, partial [Salmonella enterica]|uniref:deoxyribodipyrimidine photo-lyase n=1 Tax=Salmonella enterica TaxID=28901 RepID=UPI00398C69A5